MSNEAYRSLQKKLEASGAKDGDVIALTPEEMKELGRVRFIPADATKTLRDEFAMAALGMPVLDSSFARLAETAYEVADAMLAERRKGPKERAEGKGRRNDQTRLG